MSDEIKKILIDTTNIMPPETTKLIESLENTSWKKAVSDIVRENTKIAQSFSEITKNYNWSIINDSVRVFSETYSEYLKDIAKTSSNLVSQFSDSLKSISDAIGNIVKDIHIPEISERRKAILVASYKRWGQYGWTVMPFAEISFFNSVPETMKEANRKALSVCTKENMKSLFDDTLEHRGVKRSDYQEAVNDFCDKRYKSCALILLALIDANLIRKQPKTDKDKNRPVGLGAVKGIQKRIVSDEVWQGFFISLDCANILEALQIIFAKGNGFVEQPKVINRNFLDHGMLHRKVRRMDCIKLFLLYYNMLEMRMLKNHSHKAKKGFEEYSGN